MDLFLIFVVFILAGTFLDDDWETFTYKNSKREVLPKFTKVIIKFIIVVIAVIIAKIVRLAYFK